MGYVLAAIFIAARALLAAGALALQVLGLTGRLRKLKEGLNPDGVRTPCWDDAVLRALRRNRQRNYVAKHRDRVLRWARRKPRWTHEDIESVTRLQAASHGFPAHRARESGRRCRSPRTSMHPQTTGNLLKEWWRRRESNPRPKDFW